MTAETTFGDVRALLQQPPTQANWETLCELVDAMTDARVREELLPYIEAHLRPWDAMLRMAPKSWLERIMAGESVAAAKLATGARLSYRALGLDEAQRLGRAESLENLAMLSLWEVPLERAHLRALFGEISGKRALQRLVLTGAKLGTDGLQAITTSQQTTTLRALEVPRAQLRNHHEACALADAPMRETLEVLVLSHNPLDAHFLEELGRSGPWVSLQELELAHTNLSMSRDMLGEALDSMAPGRLRRLDLSENLLGEQGARFLANTLMVNGLEALDLHNTGLRGVGLATLWRSPLLASVQELDLSTNRVGEAWAAQPGTLGPLPELRKLDLSYNTLNGEAIQRMALDQTLCGLETLDLSHCALDDDDLIALLLNEAFRGVEHLRLNHNRLTAESIARMVRAPQLASVKILDLSHNVVGNEGATAIAHAAVLEGLTTLKLANGRITLDGLRALAASEHLSQLDHLDLNGNNINQEAARHLASSPHLKPHVRDRWLKNFPNYKKW